MSQVRAVSKGADTRATQERTLWGGGALEIGDLRLVEDGGKCSDSLVSDAVVLETASKGRVRTVGEQACQRALTEQRTFWGRLRLSARHPT